MIFVDAHCDTITKIMESESNLLSNKCHVDIERMKKAGDYVQFFAAFVDPDIYRPVALRRAVQIINKFFEQIELYNESIMFCSKYADIEAALKQKKVAALLSIEGGEALEGDISVLKIFWRLGVRSICLTWNYRNEIADGVGESITGGGLTSFGREVVKEMNSLGMLVDLSHISEKGFWDVLEITKAPVIVSHSNAKSICSHRRNLTDEQLLAIKQNGGVIGVNFYPNFLNDSGTAELSDIIKHIEHIAGLTGVDNIGIGADFDGIEITPQGINGVEDIEKVFNELLKLNYSQEFLEKLASGNFLRVLKQIL